MQTKFQTRLIHADHDLNDLQRRALRHNQGKSSSVFSSQTYKAVYKALRDAPQTLRRYPRRYAFHLMLLFFIPVALGAGQFRPTARPAATTAGQDGYQDAYAFGELRPLDAHTHSSVTSTSFDVALNADQGTVSEDADLAEILSVKHDMAQQTVVALQNRPITFETTVTADKANLRLGPGTGYDKQGQLVAGDSVTVLAVHDTWVQIKDANGQEAWIASDLIGLGEEDLAAVPQAENIPELPPALIAEVVEDGLSLRDGPGTDYVRMAKLEAGATLDLLARYEDWVQIQTGSGSIGWVTTEYLGIGEGVMDRVPVKDTIPSSNPALIGAVAEDSVNLRQGPATSYSSLGKMAAGVELDLLGQYKDWFKVKTPKGTVGWISASVLEVSSFIARRVPTTTDFPALPKPKAKPAAPRTSAPAVNVPASGLSGVASVAWGQVGKAYVYGAAGPNAFDCSGLTSYVYRQVGVFLPHSAAAQYGYGVHIGSMSNLAPGDLMFFAGTVPGKRGITHVGIYVGDGIMVHAGTPRGGVQAVNIWGSYWTSHYVGANRIF